MQIFFFYVTTYCVRYIKKESIFYTILDCFVCRLNDFFKYKFYRAFFFFSDTEFRVENISLWKLFAATTNRMS